MGLTYIMLFNMISSIITNLIAGTPMNLTSVTLLSYTILGSLVYVYTKYILNEILEIVD